MTAGLARAADVAYRVGPGVAVITFANPPVNGLGHAVRAGIAGALRRASEDPAVRAVVLTGADGTFSGGADIREFGTAASTAEPTLRQVIDRVESCEKPVVAAIAGVCLGGGLELAMAAHYRVAILSAKLGLPEVKLGLIPGAGGTQRLPRLVGIERALAMILGGEPVTAAELADTALLDRVVQGDPLDAAVELATSREVLGHPPQRARDRPIDGAALAAHCHTARARLDSARPALPAPFRAVDALEAGAGPFDEGLAVERRAFRELMDSPESKGLRHAFFAERAAGKVEDVGPDTPVRRVEEAAVIGAVPWGPGSPSRCSMPVCPCGCSKPTRRRWIAVWRGSRGSTTPKSSAGS